MVKVEYPTRLLVPATNFMARFFKLGHKGIKAILDKNDFNYRRYTITQASHLKMELEQLDIIQTKGPAYFSKLNGF